MLNARKVLCGMVVSVGLLGTAGCDAAVADSAFRVRGLVVDQSGDSLHTCSMQVHFAGDDAPTYTKKIDSTFANTFTVAPGPHAFRLIVRCDGVASKYESELFEIVGTERYENPIDLGVIRMEP